MASNTINQGAVNGIVIKPIWGTLDKQEEDDSADRFIAIVDSIKKLLDSKADIDHNHDDRYYTEPEIDTKLLAIDVEISQINSKLTPMYGYCETAASVAAKTVTITNFTLVTGRTVYIKFEHENSADDPTLNISGTGAIRIVRYGTSPVSEQEIQWSDGEVKCFTYDGISWIESGGAGGGSDRSDTISFHDSDMIVEPGTNRITFDDSDMIIHPPDGAAWLERTMEALEGGISIISTNNEHSAISNGQYIYIRMHETLPDGLYKATTDIAQNAELSSSNVTSASGALNDKSNVGHTHDERYYTESEIDTALVGKSDVGHTHDDRYYTETETDTLLSGKSANANIGIVENTNNATHNISKNQYVVWKGSLYTAKSAISSGTALSSSNLEAVNNGGINEILYKTLPDGITLNIGDSRDSAQINNQDFYRIGNVVFFKVSLKNATIQSAVNSWRTFLKLSPAPAFDVTFNASYSDTKFLGAISASNGIVYLMTDTLFTNKYLSVWGSYRI